MAKVESPKELETRLVELRDPDWNVRYGASRALVELGDEAVDALIMLIDEDDTFLRGEAIKCLGKIGSADAIAALIDCLGDQNNSIRQDAVRALTLIGAPAVRALSLKIKDDSHVVRRAAIQALSALRDPSVRGDLEAIASDMGEVAAVRWEAKLAVQRLRAR
ncbi:MAG: HEAT repeat domain-containing protein [Candidatus Poribacteria bacterium]|nr:HEAT repeat domain-containing protein [Candidatus Poribacteria bacterium]